MPTNIKKAIQAAGGSKNMANALSKSISFDTPVIAQQRAEQSPKAETFLALGKVLSNKDASNGGRLLVQSKALGTEPIWVDCVSPGAGAGYGLFTPPGIGATALIAKIPSADPPVKYVWLGCLYTTVQMSDGLRSQPNDLTETSIVKGESGGDLSDEPRLSVGIPNEFEVYGEDNTPDSWVFKHPCGHTFQLTRKVTTDRYVDEIKLKTSGNKKIIMSDAPADAGGECILLIDENENAVKIQSEHPDNPNSLDIVMGKNVSILSKAGNIEHTISRGSGNYSVDVLSTGNIELSVHKGSMFTQVNKNLETRALVNSISQSNNSHGISANKMALITGVERAQIQSPIKSVLWGGLESYVYSPGTVQVGGSTLILGGALSWTPFPIDPGYQETLEPESGNSLTGGTLFPRITGSSNSIDIYYGGDGDSDRHIEVDSDSVKLYVNQGIGGVTTETDTVEVSPGTINVTSLNSTGQSLITVTPTGIVFSVTQSGLTTTMTITSTGVEII